MVRKVRLIEESALKKASQKLYDRRSLVNVSNTEWYSLLKEEIRHSLASDGIIINRKELVDVLDNKKSVHPKAAAILGYFEAARTMYEYARHQFKENEFVLRLSDIKQIHTLLMRNENNSGGETGDFRRNNIDEAKAPFKPINMFYVRPAMEQLVKWFNDSSKYKIYDDLTLAAMAYVWFEKIHPFSDGNNRAGRIFLSYILIGQGFINVAIKGISKEEQGQYVNVLEKSDSCFNDIHRLIEKNENLTPAFINNFIKKETFTPIVQMISASMKKAADRLEGARPANLDTEAVLPLRHLAKIYDYSQDYLRNLINRGHIKALKKGKLWHVKVEDLKRYINAKNEAIEEHRKW